MYSRPSVNKMKVIAYSLGVIISVIFLKEIQRGFAGNGSFIFITLTNLFERLSSFLAFSALYTYPHEPAYGSTVIASFVSAARWVPSIFTEFVTLTDKAFLNGNYFGHKFGLVAPNDFNTGIAIPLIADAYVNFRHFGVIFFFCLFGFGATKMDHNLIGSSSISRLRFFIFSPVFFGGLEDQAGIILSGIISSYFAYIICQIIMYKSFRITR